MKLQLRKRKKTNLRKLTKTDEFGEVLSSEPLYVLLDEVDGNIEEGGTTITPSVIEKINWRDEKAIEFIPLTSNSLPDAKEDITQIVCKLNGELWCIPPLRVKEPFPLGNPDFENLLKKYETNYIQGKTFEVFVLDKEAKLFANRVRMGAIPTRDIATNDMSGGTYIDMNHTGNIVMFINGEKTHEFTKDKVQLKNKQSTIGIDSKGVIKLYAIGAEASVKVEGPSIHISSPQTKIEEANSLTKFNCYSDLQEASYGNHNFRLQFYSDYVRLQDVSDANNSKKVFQINKDGTIRINDVIIPTTHPMGFSSRNTNVTWGKISERGNLITAWNSSGGEIQFRQLGNKLYVGIDGEFYQNEGNYKLIDENSVNDYIKNYLDNHFGEFYGAFLTKCGSRISLFNGKSYSLTYDIGDSTDIYQLDFSRDDTSDGIFTIFFKGTATRNGTAKITDIYRNSYVVTQQDAPDEQYDAYFEVRKYDSTGRYNGAACIHGFYYFNFNK